MKQIDKKLIFGLIGIALLGALSVLVWWQRHTFSFSAHSSITIKDAIHKDNIVPILIVGSGPAGLCAAIYGVSANIRVVVAHGPLPGGLLTQTSLVENWPGNKSIMGPEIIKNLQEHAQELAARYLKSAQQDLDKIEFLEDTIVSIDGDGWPFKVTTERGQTFNALSVVIATGASPKLLNIAGEQEYWKKGVTSCATCDAPFYRDKDVVVAGGGDSAAEQAIQLARHAKNITILVRKDKMRATAIMQNRLKEYPSIKILYNVEPQEIVGNGTQVTGIKLLNSVTGKVSTLATDGVFLAIGHTPNSQFVKGLLAVDSQGYIEVKGRTQSTSISGIFAAGDVQDHQYRQAGTAAGYGISAALDAINFLTEIGFNTTVAASLEKQMFQGNVHEELDVFVIESVEHFAQQVENKKGLAIVDCFMEECYFCKVMDPIYKEAAHHYEGRATFLKLDIDKAPSLAKKFFVTSAPTFLVYFDGKLVGRHNGAMNKKDFAIFIENFLRA